MKLYDFYTGKAFDAYQWLGGHVTEEGAVFRTFAPSAQGISLLIQGKELPMEKIADGNFYQLALRGIRAGEAYEYRVYAQNGGFQDHCDPFGFGMELRPNHRSILRDLGEYSFSDQEWMAQRSASYDRPVNIYELHLGSWRKPSPEKANWYRYDEVGELLAPYLKEAGYNYVELLPLSEHPCDESWGYQNTGFYAPTSRYGTARELKKMINHLHREGIGVLLDFVPVHFAVDAYGLGLFDGTPLYEYPHPAVGVSEWGSYNFMHSRGEVRSFLQSCARYWLEEYHLDGLRMDAISRLLYWQGEEARGVNGNGAAFLREMNRGLKEHCPGCMLIAEDSTSYPGVTKPVEEGGLGFDYKWDLGWMHDTLEYFQTGPEYRSRDYHKLTFSMMYFYNERYLLPLSHDEVVHGKATIVQKMYGDYAGKFPQARALYLYMAIHPGKKLDFMGNEFAQLREFDESREQDWMVLDYPNHNDFRRFRQALNRAYCAEDAFWRREYDPAAFQWLDCSHPELDACAILRQGSEAAVLAAFNFGDTELEDYTLTLPVAGKLTLLLDTDWETFGGSTAAPKRSCARKTDGELKLTLPPFSGRLYRLEQA